MAGNTTKGIKTVLICGTDPASAKSACADQLG